MMQPERSRPVRVVLVEDSAIVRRAIAAELVADPRFEIVGQAASVAAAREVRGDADVVILDLGLPDGSGADLIPELQNAHPQARVIVLSANYDTALHARALEQGALAVLDKLAHLGQIGRAVNRVLRGRTPQTDQELR
jgi:DNA-binding NarL/FixJ family response regulator